MRNRVLVVDAGANDTAALVEAVRRIRGDEEVIRIIEAPLEARALEPLAVQRMHTLETLVIPPPAIVERRRSKRGQRAANRRKW